MAVPKKKPSRRLTNLRRSTGLRRAGLPRLQVCSQCGTPKSPHQLCPQCGYYQGKEEVAPSTEQPAKNENI